MQALHDNPGGMQTLPWKLDGVQVLQEKFGGMLVL